MAARPPPVAAPGRLRLHGVPALHAGGRWQPLERKAAAALAWLALAGPTPRRRLADLLWPAASEDAARNSLRQLLFKLRKAADAALVDGTEPLRLGQAWTVEPVDGELLAGWTYDDCPQFDHWLREARAASERQRMDHALQAIDADLEAGEFERALAASAALLQADALCEPVHQRQVQALYLAGRTHEALQAARGGVRLWRERLDAEPSPTFLQLLATVERAAAQAPAPQLTVAVLRPPRLVGRQRELELLAAARASGRVALVTGEPGQGKSRLLAEQAAAATGWRVLGCRPGDAGVPFGALARWLRALRAELPAALEPLPAALAHVLPECAPAGAGRGGAGIEAGLAEVLARATGAGLAGLALDDLHFADAASLELLAACMEAPSLSALRWTLARRPAEGDPALDRLADLLLDGGRLEPVRLEPLDVAGMRELLESLALPGLAGDELAAELWRATGGNPMFALETLKALIQQGVRAGSPLPRPPNVAALVERRLRQLSATALALARVAALAGPDFDATLAAHVLALPVLALADAWQELEAAQVLKDQAFAHDLIYEATLASVPAPVRRHARRGIAEYLATHDGEPARIAAHWLAAGEPARAAPHFVAAGRRAEAAARYGEARQLLEEAARCHELAADPAAAFDTRLALADLLMEAGGFAAAHQVLDALASGDADPDQRLRHVMQRMHVLVRDSQGDAAVALGEGALADPLLLEDATPRRVAELRWTLATCLRTAGRAEAALAQLALAEPLLAQSPDATWRCWFHSQRAIALSLLGQVGEASRSQAQSVAAAREVGRHRMLAGCLQNSATLATAAGQIVETLDLLDECLSLMAESGGADAFTLHVRVQRGRALVWLGRYRDALAVLEPLADGGPALPGHNRARVLAALAELWTHLGQPARCDRMMAAMAAAPDDDFGRQLNALLEEEITWLRLRPPAPALAIAFEPARNPTATHLATARLLAWRRQPEPGDLEALQRAGDGWRARGEQGHALLADVIAAGWAARRGDREAAARHAARALESLRRLGAPGIYRPGLHLALVRATDEEPALRERALRGGVEWVRNVARFHVPEAYRSSFLGENRVNRELLGLAAASGV
ncbi:MAG: AAA family ATPase [Rubrivivax sp.]|nr:AAA family ATPase [Rubrivivax sp.]